MLEQRNLKLDLLALGLLGLTVFLAASLLSYDRADPPGNLVYPAHTEAANICGRCGALVSTLLLDAFGLGAYYLLFSLVVLDSLLLTRRRIGEPLLRAFGWMLSLTGFSTLAAMALPHLSPGPVIGAGGYLGAAGRGLLEMNFASVGAYIVVVSLILAGLLLSTDYHLLRIVAWVLHIPVRGLGGGALRVALAYAGRFLGIRPEVEHLDEEEEEEEIEQEASLPVRIGGRPADGQTSDVEGGEQGLSDEQDEEDEPGAASHERGGSRFASPRVRQPEKSHREEVIEQIQAESTSGDAADYELPRQDLLLESEPFCFEEHEKEVRRKARILEKTFADFGFQVRVVEIQTGPVIAQFEVELEAGLRLSRITGLADDLAIALRVPSVRIVAPIPNKNTVGIEVPNAQRQLVRLREVMEESNGKAQAMRIPVYLGKDVSGNPIVVDLASLPHLLIAGRTGTGKSVCLNSIIASILMTRRPDEVRMLLIDPKMVELSPYKHIPHLMHPVVTDMRKAEAILAWAVEKMEQRYELLARAGVRHLSVYNQLGQEELMERIGPADEEERARIPVRMPFIVIMADEMADLMLTSAKEVESYIIRLAQKSRAVGIHLVLATQKPTVDVITGLIKSNLPARICFEVASRTDSRVVLDEMGADRLLGNGDMLFLRPGTSTLIRGQGTYLSDDEIARVIDAVATSEPQFVKELVQLPAADPQPEGRTFTERDELYEAAVDVVVREGRGSVSLLQRALGIGYGRAARLIDYMAEDGIVGPYNGSQAREILVDLEEWEQMRGQPNRAKRPAASRRRSNKILLNPATPHYLTESDRTTPVNTVSQAAGGSANRDARFGQEERTEDPFEADAAAEEYARHDPSLGTEYGEADEEEDFDEDEEYDEQEDLDQDEDEDCDEEEDFDSDEDEEYDEEDSGEYDEYDEAEAEETDDPWSPPSA
jgi:S-DNA-T family DNA segregation ATPase FtsK/SpoIIIE